MSHVFWKKPLSLESLWCVPVMPSLFVALACLILLQEVEHHSFEYAACVFFKATARGQERGDSQQWWDQRDSPNKVPAQGGRGLQLSHNPHPSLSEASCASAAVVLKALVNSIPCQCHPVSPIAGPSLMVVARGAQLPFAAALLSTTPAT